MNLEDKFNAQGSALTGPLRKYNKQSNLAPMNVFDSTLDLNGITRQMSLVTKQTTAGLAASTLDLDGQTPEKYLDNKPE